MHARYAPNIRYPKVAGFYHQLEERTSHGGAQRISGNFNSCCSGFSQILKLAGPPHSLLPTGLNVHDRDSLGFAWRRHLPDPLPFDTMPILIEITELALRRRVALFCCLSVPEKRLRKISGLTWIHIIQIADICLRLRAALIRCLSEPNQRLSIIFRKAATSAALINCT